MPCPPATVQAGRVLDAVKAGKLNHIFLIGGWVGGGGMGVVLLINDSS